VVEETKKHVTQKVVRGLLQHPMVEIICEELIPGERLQVGRTSENVQVHREDKRGGQTTAGLLVPSASVGEVQALVVLLLPKEGIPVAPVTGIKWQLERAGKPADTSHMIACAQRWGEGKRGKGGEDQWANRQTL